MFLDPSEAKRSEGEASERERQDAEAAAEWAHANRVAVMGYLAVSILHEVKQPIAAIVINTHAALRWLDGPAPNVDRARQALSRILGNSARADALVGRTRDLARKTPRPRDSVEINTTIREAIELVHAEAARNGVSVKTEFVETLPLVSGDRVELQQVILNLIINAIEAMTGIEEGPREVLVTTERLEADAVLVSVRDSGPGLAPGVQQDLFKPFHTTKPNGLGLGLSICRSIVEGHGGSLWASPNTPRGAVFQFTLPSNSPIASPP